MAAGTIFNGVSVKAQSSVNCDLTLKTTIETFNVYKHNPSGAILFKAKMYIDADGSPRAYGPNNSGLDYTANGGHPGNWWGVVTNNSGNPIIQGSSGPYPGMYVSTTSLTNSAYPSTSPSHYVNSEAIPFFVLPSAVTSLGSIHLGDIGYVYNTLNGQGCYAVFADGGPAGSLGEGSIYLANQLGINSNARTGGTSQGVIDYIVFPNSGLGQGTIPTISQINSIGTAQINTVGGTGITSCISPSSSCGTPSALSAGSITQSSALLSWSVVSGSTSYNVEYKLSSSSTWTTVTSTSASKSISGLNASSVYQFQVQAVCSVTGSYSSLGSFTTSAGTSSCGVPSGLTAGSVTSGSAVLNWNAVSGANSYNIQYKQASSSVWTTITSSSASTSISGLSASTTYQFQVQAVCSISGLFSSAASFTTSASISTNTTLTIGTATSPYSAHPFGSANSDERAEYIIKKSEMVSSGWSSSSTYLKSIAFNVSSAASSQPLGSFTITIAHTSAASFAGTSFLTGANAVTVYSGTYTTTTGWNTFNFNTPFAYDGTSNLLITICWNNSSFSANSSVLANSYSDYMALYYRANISNGDVCSQTSGTQSYYRPNAKLAFSSSAQANTFNGGQERSFQVPDQETASPLSQFSKETLDVYPNPIDGNVLYGKFSGQLDKQIAIHIYDLLGREVFEKEIFAESGNFSLIFSDELLKPGIYTLAGMTSTNLFTKKIVVK